MVVDPTESCPVKGYTHTLQPTTTPAHPRELWIFQLPATTTNASLSSSSMSDHLLAHLDGLCLPLDTLSSSTPIPLPGAPGYALFHVGSKTTSNDGHDNGNNGQTGGSEMTSFSLLLPNKSTRKYHAVKPTSLHCFKLAIHTDALLLSSTATSSSSKKGKKKATNEHDGQQLVFKDALVEKGRMIRDSVYVPPQPPVAMKMQLAATEAQDNDEKLNRILGRYTSLNRLTSDKTCSSSSSTIKAGIKRKQQAEDHEEDRLPPSTSSSPSSGQKKKKKNKKD